jgi:hypothetical protein
MTFKAFISYRRSDCSNTVGELYTLLLTSFSRRQLFLDEESIAPGSDFRLALENDLKRCSVLLCVIGPDWLDAAKKSGQRRLDDPQDYVRTEIATALRKRIPVVPLLVGGAKMPTERDLPEELKDLSFRQAIELPLSLSKADIGLVEDNIRLHLGPHLIDRTTMRVASVASICAPLFTLLVTLPLGLIAAWGIADNGIPGPPGPPIDDLDILRLIVCLALLLGTLCIGPLSFAWLMEYRYKGMIGLIGIVTGYGFLLGVSLATFMGQFDPERRWPDLVLPE